AVFAPGHGPDCRVGQGKFLYFLPREDVPDRELRGDQPGGCQPSPIRAKSKVTTGVSNTLGGCHHTLAHLSRGRVVAKKVAGNFPRTLGRQNYSPLVGEAQCGKAVGIESSREGCSAGILGSVENKNRSIQSRGSKAETIGTPIEAINVLRVTEQG